MWCNFQTSSAFDHRELALVVPHGDPEQLRESNLGSRLKNYPKLPLSCDFQPSSAFYHRELPLVVPRDDPEQLRESI